MLGEPRATSTESIQAVVTEEGGAGHNSGGGVGPPEHASMRTSAVSPVLLAMRGDKLCAAPLFPFISWLIRHNKAMVLDEPCAASRM